ncbi:MAG: (4Fe-4S)-binding protein, partial [Mariprofundus sp.]
MSGKQSYEGKQISVCFDAARCIHAGNCVKGLPEVFRAGADGDWIQPDAATAEQVAAVCDSCPSGALSYQRRDGGPAEAKPEMNTMIIEDDGPLTVHADFTVNNEDPGGYRATLCRCGISKNRPWCDGSHTDVAFQDRCSMPVCTEASTLPTGLPMNIQTFANGPLLLEG